MVCETHSAVFGSFRVWYWRTASSPPTPTPTVPYQYGSDVHLLLHYRGVDTWWVQLASVPSSWILKSYWNLAYISWTVSPLNQWGTNYVNHKLPIALPNSICIVIVVIYHENLAYVLYLSSILLLYLCWYILKVNSTLIHILTM